MRLLLVFTLFTLTPGPLIDGTQERPEIQCAGVVCCDRLPCEVELPPEVCPKEPAPGAGATPGGPYADSLTNTEEGWRSVVASYFCHDYAIEEALHIIACESNGDPDVVNPASGTTGLFQIAPGWFDHPEMGDPYNPADNTAFAAWLWKDSGGWSHWHCRPVP